VDDAAFLHLIRRKPFGSAGDAEWQGLTRRLLGSLSRFLALPLEFVGNRRHDEDNFCPLVRSVGPVVQPLDVRVAGMISCGPPDRHSGLRIDALLFVFVGGRRVRPSGLHFVTCAYLGPGTSDFGEQWDPYTFDRFFGGAEAELPGCSQDAEPGAAADPAS
jgi:hypothetical protein